MASTEGAGEKRNGQRDQKRLAERRIFRPPARREKSLNCNKEQNNTSRDAYGRLIQTEELHQVVITTKKQTRAAAPDHHANRIPRTRTTRRRSGGTMLNTVRYRGCSREGPL